MSPNANLFRSVYSENTYTERDELKRMLRRYAALESARLERYLNFLATTGSTTPFIGLFGTVWGIMNAFRGIGAAGSASLAVVAPGIAEALITTAVGLAAAIPAVVAYNYFLSRANRMIIAMDDFSEELVDYILTDRVVAEVTVPAEYEYLEAQTVRRLYVELTPPSMDDQTDDWSRLQTAFRLQHRFEQVTCSLSLLQRMGGILRDGDWNATAVVDVTNGIQSGEPRQVVRLIDLQPGLLDEYWPLWGCAVDIGTTTVTLWLVDLITGQVKAQASEYNGQIARGEDVISRIIFTGKNGGNELRQRVLDTINNLLELACKRVKMPQGRVKPEQVVKMTIAGSTAR